MLWKSETPWLRLRDGKKNYLLARGERYYFFIDVNKNLTHEAEQALCEFGISDENLKTLQLSFLAVPVKQVRGIAVESTYAGAALYIYLTSGKREQYTFFETYDEEQLDAVFPSVERFTPPKAHAKGVPKEDRWRANGQEYDVYRKLENVHAILGAVGVLLTLGYLSKRHWALLVACILILAVFVLFEIFLPAYFTMIPREKSRKAKQTKAIELTFTPLVMCGFLCFAMDFGYFFDWRSYLYALAFAFAVSLILRYHAEEFRRDQNAIAIVFAFSILLGVVLTAHVNEAFDFTEPDAVHILEVEALRIDRSGKGADRFYCTVVLPDGEDMEFGISKEAYDSLAIGELVQVEVNTGILGIRYEDLYLIE